MEQELIGRIAFFSAISMKGREPPHGWGIDDTFKIRAVWACGSVMYGCLEHQDSGELINVDLAGFRLDKDY